MNRCADVIRTIVVPTDCSDVSRTALLYANGLASRLGAEIVAVYGGRFSTRLDGEGVAAALASAADVEAMELPVRRCVEAALAECVTCSGHHRVVVADLPPVDAILETSHESSADLIIMATRDRNRLARAVLGSVTDGVLHRSGRPVLILREQTVWPARFSRLLCIFRNTPHSAAAVRQAIGLSQALGADLHLTYAVRRGDPDEIGEHVRELVAGRDVEMLRLGSSPGAEAIAAAARLSADLLVIGTHHRRFSDPTSVGTPSSQIVRMAHCPVLTVC